MNEECIGGVQPLDGPIRIPVKLGRAPARPLGREEIQAILSMTAAPPADRLWERDDVADVLRDFPIKAMGHNGRDRMQFWTTRPLTASEAYRLGRLGAMWPESIAANQTEFELRW